MRTRMSPPALPPQQLLMHIPAATVRCLPDVPLPPEYALRGYRPEDAAHWLALLEKAGFDPWSRVKLDEYMAAPERRQGSQCVVFRDTPVAATFASRRSVDPPVGGLDYVIGDPDHSGRGLGRAVCTAVLRYLVEHGYARVSLTTDDWRLPALHVYLTLGFRPVMTRVDMPERWEAIYQRLGFGSSTQGISP